MAVFIGRILAGLILNQVENLNRENFELFKDKINMLEGFNY